MSSPPYNLARSLSDSFTTRSPIVFSVIEMIRGQKRKLSVTDREVEFTKACRFESAYGEHEAMGNTICKCNLTAKGHCLNKKQCPCFKGGLKCSSKCHLGKVCDLPK